jgi:hypothetical protein
MTSTHASPAIRPTNDFPGRTALLLPALFAKIMFRHQHSFKFAGRQAVQNMSRHDLSTTPIQAAQGQLDLE